MLDFLKPAPFIPEIADKGVVHKEYRYWRIRIFYSMYIGYVFYYLSRKSFNVAMPILAMDLALSNAETGKIMSAFAATYGISKFVSGILSDRSNPRYFMAIGLMVTGVINIVFGMSSSSMVFMGLWALNGWFQGFGWPPVGRLLTQWYSQSERGRWWGLWNSSHNVGGGMIPFIVLPVIAIASAWGFSGWRYGMYVPGIMCIAMGTFLINRLRDTPQSLGLPSIEKYRNDYPDQKVEEKEEPIPLKEMLWKYIFTNKYIWVLAISYIFIYLIRSAINDWSAKYLVEMEFCHQSKASYSIAWFEAGGVLGALAAGWLSDKIFAGRRGPTNVLFTLGTLGSVLLLWYLPHWSCSILLNNSIIGLIGFFIFGPQMLIGIAAAELSHKKAVGTATGFIAIFANAGSFIAGYPLGTIIDQWGWNGFFAMLIVCGLCASLLLSTLWNVRARSTN